MTSTKRAIHIHRTREAGILKTNELKNYGEKHMTIRHSILLDIHAAVVVLEIMLMAW